MNNSGRKNFSPRRGRISLLRGSICLALSWLVIGSGSLFAVDFGDDVPKEKYPGVGVVQVADQITEKGPHIVSLGTGTLIAPDIVLTAAHVVAKTPTPRHLFVKFESQEKPIAAIAYRTHPGYLNSIYNGLSPTEKNWLKSTTNWDCAQCDVALIKLERSVQGMEMYPLSSEFPAAQTPLTLVGYGQTADKALDGKRRSGSLKVVRIYNNMVLVMPGNEKNQKCDHGDSGGPLLVQRGNKLEIAATVQGQPSLMARIGGLTSDEWTAVTAAPYIKPWTDVMIKDLARVKVTNGQPVAYIRRSQPDNPQLATSIRQLMALDGIGMSPEFFVNRVFIRGVNEPVAMEQCLRLKKTFGVSDDLFYPPLTSATK